MVFVTMFDACRFFVVLSHRMRRLALFLALVRCPAGPCRSATHALSKAAGLCASPAPTISALPKAHRGRRSARSASHYRRCDPAYEPERRRQGHLHLCACGWYAGDLNRGVQDDILDPTFKPTTGVAATPYRYDGVSPKKAATSRSNGKAIMCKSISTRRRGMRSYDAQQTGELAEARPRGQRFPPQSGAVIGLPRADHQIRSGLSAATTPATLPD